MKRISGLATALVLPLALVPLPLATIGAASAAETPVIRASAANTVPECVTPERLMKFARQRNKKLDGRFAQLAKLYQQHGTELGVRWDFAFFQMLVETNSLSFKTSRGKPGNIQARQNNLAGLSKPGDNAGWESFPDLETGVLAHLHHVRLYSGEPVENPAAARTKQVESVILPWAQALGHPVTFEDMTARWAPSNKSYASDLAAIAATFSRSYCKGSDLVPETGDVTAAAETAPDTTTAAAAPEGEAMGLGAATVAGKPTKTAAKASKAKTRSLTTGETIEAAGTYGSDTSSLTETVGSKAAKLVKADASLTVTSMGSEAEASSGDVPLVDETAETGSVDETDVAALPAPPTASVKPSSCKVFTASYGGAKTLLIQSVEGDLTRYTALAVHEGKEKAQAKAFIDAYAKGGRTIGQFGSQNEALSKAFQLCPAS